MTIRYYYRKVLELFLPQLKPSPFSFMDCNGNDIWDSIIIDFSPSTLKGVKDERV